MSQPISEPTSVSDHQANTTIRILSNQKGPTWATANTATTPDPKSPHLTHTTSNPTTPFTYITQWLIDSGCSAHMTPHLSDLSKDILPSEAMVQVANGNIVRANKQGTALITLTDIHTHQKARHTSGKCPLCSRIK